MDPITFTWVAVGSIGLTFAVLILREVYQDRDAAIKGKATLSAQMYVREAVRGAWFRVAKLSVAVGAGILPFIWPSSGPRPVWVRIVTIVLLIVLNILLTVDAGLALRSKRQFLNTFNPSNSNSGEIPVVKDPPAEPPSTNSP